MKFVIYIIVTVLFAGQFTVSAKNKERLEHLIVAGMNIGATSPGNIPPEVRKVTAWYPYSSFQLGYNIVYNMNDRWAAGSGITMDNKGMGVINEVKHLYTEVRLEADGNYLIGYFSGKNKTDVKMAYITIPFFLRYRLGKQWRLLSGMYASYAHSTSFSGSVWDGYLRTPDPTGLEISIVNREDATFDFGNDMRNFDFGLSIGGEYRINSRFKVSGIFSRGLTSVLKRDLKFVPFNMYNMYMMFGIAYLL
ncbi:MAG: PorT family protein [Dysgonamonadaceae bacterium]|jgi:hypothetical protein|nr:PorT family protein [Dysgonamonadaceae bacterium]